MSVYKYNYQSLGFSSILCLCTRLSSGAYDLSSHRFLAPLTLSGTAPFSGTAFKHIIKYLAIPMSFTALFHQWLVIIVAHRVH